MSVETKLWEFNPWWMAKESIARDDKIAEWEDSLIKYDPNLKYVIEYDSVPENPIIYTLRGTRQVGKTTLIKLQIRKFLMQDGKCPWNIFYYSFDIERSKSELASVIQAYLKLSSGYREDSRIYLFLDEITSIDDWQKGIKYLYESGQLRDCTVLATGSKSSRILHAAERLPGRRGRTTVSHDLLLPPMKFAEFVKFRNEEIKEFMFRHRLFETHNRKKMSLSLLAKKIPEEITHLSNYFIDGLNDCLDEYMLTGGIPKVVDEKVRNNFLSTGLYEEYLEGMKGEWEPKSVDLLKQFAGAITVNLGSITSWSKLRRHADLGSAATAQDYALALKDLSVASVIHRYGKSEKPSRIDEAKKIYFSDPFYLHMFHTWHNSKDPFRASGRFLTDDNRGRMAEGIVSNHLIRLAFALVENKQMFDYNNNVFFWNDGDREVDFVLHVDDLVKAPIEVKYRHRIDHRELGGIGSFQDRTKVKSGLVLSKNDLDTRPDYLVVPASVFLMLV